MNPDDEKFAKEAERERQFTHYAMTHERPKHTEASDGLPHIYKGFNCTVCGHYIFEGMTQQEITEFHQSFGPWGA